MESLMSIPLQGYEIRCDYENKAICLNDLETAAKAYHHKLTGLFHENTTPVYKVLGSTSAIAFAEACLRNGYGKAHWVEGRGSAKRTMACVHFAIWFAERLSPDFHFLVIDEFVNNRLFDFRLDGIEHFKTLNVLVDSLIQKTEGRAASHGHFIAISKIVKKSTEPRDAEDYVTWNSQGSLLQSQRLKIIEQLETMLKYGVVKDWGHLKELTKTVSEGVV